MSYFASDLEAAFRAVDTTSQQMKNAIEKWYDMYYEKKATEESDPCQRIPYTIVRKLTKTAFSEYAASSKDAFVSAVIREADRKKRKTCKYKSSPNLRKIGVYLLPV